MKLGELRKAIREFKGNPTMTLLAPPGATRNMKLVVQKTVLMEELGNVFPAGKAAETEMEFNSETGVISCPSVDIGGGGSFGSITRIMDGDSVYIEVKDSAGNVRMRFGSWPQEGEILDVVGLHSDGEDLPKPVDEDTVDPQEDAIGLEPELDLGSELESLDDLGDDDVEIELDDIDLDDE